MMLNMMETNTLSHTVKTGYPPSPQRRTYMSFGQDFCSLQKARCPTNHSTDWEGEFEV